MLRSIPVVDKSIDYRLWELVEKITRFHKILAWINTFFLHFTNQQPRQANKSDSSLEVVPRLLEIQLCLTMFWKIAQCLTSSH